MKSGGQGPVVGKSESSGQLQPETRGAEELAALPGGGLEATVAPAKVLLVALPVGGLGATAISAQVEVVAREQESCEKALMAREQVGRVNSREEPVSQGGHQPAPEETRTDEPARAETEITETATDQVQNNSECLRCRFGCDFEEDLDNHMEREHNVPKPLKRALHPDGTPCQDYLTKEEVLVGHTDKIERLELEITGLVY